MTDRPGEQLVADYLDRLEAALAEASPDRRRELLDEIGAHVAEARAALPGGGDERAVRELLDRIGEPGEIAAAALAEDGAAAAAAPHASAGSAPPLAPPARPGWREGLAVPLLLFGGVAVPLFGWFVGVALLWWSKVWSTRDKAIGTFALPFGLLPAMTMNFIGGESCSEWSDGRGRVIEECTGGGADVVAIAVFALLVLIPLATAVHLLLRLRTRRPAEPASGSAAQGAPA